MARASSSSSSRTSGEGAWGEGEGPPIPYRRGPLQYSPAVLCFCGNKAARWISWSDENPRRRYYTCIRRRAGGCRYWFWAEEPHPVFIQELLIDLRNAVWAARRRNRELLNQLGDAAVMVEEHKEEVRALRAEMDAIANQKEGTDATRDTICRLEKELVVYKLLVKCCVVVLVVVFLKKWLFN
ncbi:unnamed protein product [Urochloa decumbens]|uniref:GRF-type domain-containing protein n=1 Tax=Urochloa decumbens TaxID=240449 RepID=A0ABC9C4L1_9POAL